MQTYALSSEALQHLQSRVRARLLQGMPLWLLLAAPICVFSIGPLGLDLRDKLTLVLLLIIGPTLIQWTRIRNRFATYKVVVDEEAICVVTSDGANTVVRGKIRSIWEKGDGLYLSERKWPLSYLLGYAWIARDLKDYDAIKQLAAEWTNMDTVGG